MGGYLRPTLCGSAPLRLSSKQFVSLELVHALILETEPPDTEPQSRRATESLLQRSI